MSGGRGKVVGKHQHQTVSGWYNLEIRVDVDNDENPFTVLVPKTPDAKLAVRDPMTFDPISASTLDEVKRAVRTFLNERDTTEYVDVLEYRCGSDSMFDREASTVQFDFRVARVSTVKDRNGDPKLERMVTISEDGKISDYLWFGEPDTRPRQHASGFHVSMPFTVERWRKMKTIREGIEKLHYMLKDVFDESDAGARLDSIGGGLNLLGAIANEGKEVK
jgi:hypothetical protein